MRRIKVFSLQIMQRMKAFIHQQDHWANFTWKTDEFVNSLSEVRNLQGTLQGKMQSVGFELKNEATLDWHAALFPTGRAGTWTSPTGLNGL